jgi:hypothetical protein
VARNNARWLVIATAAVLSGACASGGRALPSASTPAGVNVYMQLGLTVIEGELLEISDSGLVVIRGGQIAYVPLMSVRVGRYPSGAAVVTRQGANPRVALPVTPDDLGSPAGRRELRLLSRYPGGISGRVLAALLAEHGQDAPAVLRR